MRQLCKTIKTKADPDNIEVLDGSRVKIDDRTVLVKPLDTHFFFSKLPLSLEPVLLNVCVNRLCLDAREADRSHGCQNQSTFKIS